MKGWHRTKSQLREFHSNTSGMALLYATIMLPVIIGFSLLAIDVGRVWSLQSSLQHGADALALAGAAELDQRPDAVDRANRAIANLITTNKSLFATSVVTIDGSAIGACYSATLPADHLPFPSCMDVSTSTARETASATARFVKVTVNPVTFNTIFPANFLGVASSGTTNAEAVAGFQAAVCNFTPLFICNPYEPATGTTDVFADYGLYAHIANIANRRKLFQFKAHDNSAQWSPGNYGFLEANAGPGAKALGDEIASPNPTGCFIQNGVNTKPGNTTVEKNAFNVRFDLYAGSYGNATAKTNYPPAQNVRKGHIVRKMNNNNNPQECNDDNSISQYNPADITAPANINDGIMGLPRDGCFETNSCTGAGGRMGDGDWAGDSANNPAVTVSFEQYWTTNFAGVSRPLDPGGTIYSNTNLPSRYDIYRYEIDNNLLNRQSAGATFGAVPFKEHGLPRCNAGAGMAIPDRRIIYGAILNCRAAGLGPGAGGPYQSVAFGKFFMTEPMGNPPDSTLWAELVDVVKPGQADSVARDIVQLYR